MLYAQDLTVGQRFPFGTYRMEEAEIIEFATRYDPLYIHIDPEAAAKGPFGGVIASGLHTMAVYQRLVAEALWWKVAGIAGKRFEIDLQRPVRPGTVLTGHAEIESITPRPERNDALMTLRAVITDGSKPMLSLRLESLIQMRPG
ncbi:MAG: hypothetical protein M9932_03510 [Xanthobacteraceae bacterium]|nr:hypothetical protein [Xanthobacteraceae bacterium]